MAHAMVSGQAVSLQELLLAQMFESEALLNVLERKGLVTKAEVLEAKAHYPPLSLGTLPNTAITRCPSYRTFACPT